MVGHVAFVCRSIRPSKLTLRYILTGLTDPAATMTFFIDSVPCASTSLPCASLWSGTLFITSHITPALSALIFFFHRVTTNAPVVLNPTFTFVLMLPWYHLLSFFRHRDPICLNDRLHLLATLLETLLLKNNTNDLYLFH